MLTAAVDTISILTAIYFLIAVKHHHVNSRSTGQGITVPLFSIKSCSQFFKIIENHGQSHLVNFKFSLKI